MRSTSVFRLTVFTLAVAAVTALSSVAPAARTGEARERERFTAFAVDIGVPGRASADQVEIVVERYSTDAERDRLLKALVEKGPEKLLDTLQGLPRVGSIRTPNSIGYDLHFARKHPGADGGEEISLATDRYITFWEAKYRPRTIDYPFTLIELHIGPDGAGEGKMSLATKIMFDKKNNAVVLEDYKSQPVLLQNVRRESTSQ
jgi:hypothetical protein